MTIRYVFIFCSVLLLAACGSINVVSGTPGNKKSNDIVLYSLGLVGTNYRFGGKNPEQGFDCSGMVSYVYQQAAGINLSGSAANIARQGKPVVKSDMRPGDLVFFNTMNRAFSHVGIYIGDGRFVNAPSTNGKVRIDRLDNRYYAQRFDAVRRYFD